MIDDFLAELSAQLRTSSRRRARIIEEAREHPVDRATDLERSGATPDEARVGAVASFGDAEAVAREFNAQAAATRMRRTPIAILAYAVVVVGGFLAAAVPAARPAHATSASIALRVAFFLGTVGVQVAFVAGLRAASIVAAGWRRPAAPAHERRVVRAAAVIAVAGLALAAMSWTVSFVLVFLVAGLHGDRTLVAGAIGLGAAAALGGLALVQLAMRPPEPGNDEAVAYGGPAATGEHVARLVVRYPRTACAVVAIGAGLLAMRGADSTALGALPSGGAEVVAVVVAFVLLGPRLGLRGATPARPGPA